MARDPLMQAASEYAKAVRRLNDLREQHARAQKRCLEIELSIETAEKEVAAAKKVLDGAAGSVPAATEA